MLDPALALGVSVYGNGGLNTDYGNDRFNCGGAAANMLCGSGTAGRGPPATDRRADACPTNSRNSHAIGASVLLGYQRFKASGLAGVRQRRRDSRPSRAPPATSPTTATTAPRALGLRVGWLGQVAPGLTLGAAYASKIDMSKLRQVPRPVRRTGRLRRTGQLEPGRGLVAAARLDAGRRLRPHCLQQGGGRGQQQHRPRRLGRRQRRRLRLAGRDRRQAGPGLPVEQHADASGRLEPRQQPGARQ